MVRVGRGRCQGRDRQDGTGRTGPAGRDRQDGTGRHPRDPDLGVVGRGGRKTWVRIPHRSRPRTLASRTPGALVGLPPLACGRGRSRGGRGQCDSIAIGVTRHCDSRRSRHRGEPPWDQRIAARKMVDRGRIELPTPGFSVPVSRLCWRGLAAPRGETRGDFLPTETGARPARLESNQGGRRRRPRYPRACRPGGPCDADGDAMLTTFEGGQAKMAPGLAGPPVTEIAEGSCELITGDVARKSQAVMTSSRTKWRRMILGTSSSSKWQRTASRTFTCRPAMSSASVKIDYPRARAVKPPSGASSTRKITSDALRCPSDASMVSLE